jgi:serine phosphatase RsbU (regulator of sigma subunit)
MACAVHRPPPVDFFSDCLVVNPTTDVAWNIGAFRVQAESRSAAGPLGGDFFAFRVRSPERLALVIGDACGRGEEGAHLLPSVLARVEQLAAGAARPSHFLDYLNRGLFRELSSDRFVTASALEIDAAAGTLTIANAGHVPVVLRRKAGGATIVGRASGPPLGILSNSSYFDETYQLGRGDLIVLMTDGIVEAFETDLAEMPRLTALVEETLGNGDDLHRRVFEQLRLHQDEREPDDMTLLSLELLPSSVRSSRLEQQAAI